MSTRDGNAICVTANRSTFGAFELMETNYSVGVKTSFMGNCRLRLDQNGLFIGEQTVSVEGLITLRSSFGPGETLKRFQAEVQSRGMTIFGHIDHAAGAAAVGLRMRPTDLLIFGAARAGTPLMESAQTIGIDLPLKALVWQDEAKNTFLSYNDPAYVVDRHGVGKATRPAIEAMSVVLKEMAKKSIMIC